MTDNTPSESGNKRNLIEGNVATIRTENLDGSSDIKLIRYLRNVAGTSNGENEQQRRTLTLRIDLGAIDPSLGKTAITVKAVDMLISGHIFIADLHDHDGKSTKHFVGKTIVDESENPSTENLQNTNQAIKRWIDENKISPEASMKIMQAVAKFELSVIGGYELSKDDVAIADGSLRDAVKDLDGLACTPRFNQLTNIEQGGVLATLARGPGQGFRLNS